MRLPPLLGITLGLGILGASLLSLLGASAPQQRPVWWTDFDSQPPPPLPSLLRALAWWHAQGHGQPPAHLIRHLPTFIPLYLSYKSIWDPKKIMPFEAWLLLNGFSDPTLCDCLVELYRLAEG